MVSDIGYATFRIEKHLVIAQKCPFMEDRTCIIVMEECVSTVVQQKLLKREVIAHGNSRNNEP